MDLGEKTILDACCSSRMFWFDKENPHVVFADIRSFESDLCDGRKLEVKPDVISDFTSMVFEDESFNLVVFDPPHMTKLGLNTWMAQKYGVLLPTWQTDLRAGFDECMRVLKPMNKSNLNMRHISEIIAEILEEIRPEKPKSNG